ncbi:anti-sigma factor domain-containing protein [Anaerocolumna aminovalerica]|uniref:anti-sigma-I factor RsgI family protein n=1 Tax=Anaerocolumna aminovalerica TaxID=1527 RepID=UPI000BE2ABDB|nr:hypothetical protein [Anaerocolumna aminovalerica]
MKAIIVEIKNGLAAVLSDDGNIIKVKNRNYEIGQVITMKKQKIHITGKLAVTAASAAVLFLASGIGIWAYTSPYSYVSLDVNPSIEYTVNCFDLVIDVKAVNDDGEELLGQINLNNLNNKTIHAAIAATINEIADSGYFDETAYGPATDLSDSKKTVNSDNSTADENPHITGGIIITASSKNEKKTEKLIHKLEGTAKDTVEGTGDEVEIEAISVGYDRVKRAKEFGVTPGKLNLVEKLQASAEDPESIDIEEWLNKPVKDIMKAIKANRKGQSSDSTGNAVGKAAGTSELATAISESKVQKAEAKAEKTKQKAADKAQKEDAKTQKAEQKAADKGKKADTKARKAKEKAADKIRKVAKIQKAKQKADDKARKEDAKALKAKQKAADKARKEDAKALKAKQKVADKARKEDAKALKAKQKTADKSQKQKYKELIKKQMVNQKNKNLL